MLPFHASVFHYFPTIFIASEVLLINLVCLFSTSFFCWYNNQSWRTGMLHVYMEFLSICRHTTNFPLSPYHLILLIFFCFDPLHSFHCRPHVYTSFFWVEKSGKIINNRIDMAGRTKKWIFDVIIVLSNFNAAVYASWHSQLLLLLTSVRTTWIEWNKWMKNDKNIM